MNIKDLNQLDIKNVDLNQVKDYIQKRPEILVNILLIAATIFVIIYMFTGQQKKANNLNYSTIQMKEKWEVVKSLKIIREENKKFVKDFPKTIPGDRLIDKLSEFALLHNVQVVSFLPAKQKSNDILEYTTASLTVSSVEYSDIVSFIKDIEESPYALRIERWSGGQQLRHTNRRGSSPQEEPSKDIIVAQIDIGSIKLKQ